MLAKFSVLLAVLSVNLASAALLPRGTFITAPCNTDADCNSGCCAFGSGKCAGAIIALTRDGGCGRGDAASNSIAAGILRGNCPGTNAKRAPLSPDPAGVKNVGNGAGGQFITGQCNSNADCGSGCCATLGNIGICSGPGAADQQGKTGCGFGGGAGGAAPPATPPPATPPPAAPAGGTGLKPDPNGAKNVGNGKGGQFITGQCNNNADCASACCATLGNIGICSGPGAATQQGKTGCGFAGGAAPATPPPATPPPASPQQNGAGAGGAAGGRLTAGATPIGATCGNDNDCTTGCCGTATGICTLAKQAGANGCGKGGAPNNAALDLINGNAPVC